MNPKEENHMEKISVEQQVIGLIVWLVLCFSASAVGAIASIEAQSFYGSLNQPSWAPPAWLFGPVWSTLYGMMAVAAWLIWRRGGFKLNQTALTLFLIQLMINGLWSWVFFVWNLGSGSFVNVIVLWVVISFTLAMFWRTDKLAGILLVPYLLWVSFACALNYTVWQLNPQILG